MTYIKDDTFDVQATNVNDENYLVLNAKLYSADENGNVRWEEDRKAVQNYFLNHINPNTYWAHSIQEKIKFLVTNEYYEKEFLEMYDDTFIKKAFQKAYSYKFRFPTFVGALKFYSSYALRTFDGRRYLERFEDRVTITALYMAQGDKKFALSLIEEIITGRLQPATPTFLNAGKKSRGELISCFLLNVEDDLNSIGRAWNSAAQLSKRGGGVALNLTNIRGKNDPIKNVENASSGVIPVMKILEDTFSYANQLGARQGAGAVYLNAHHIDIKDFLDTKRENADEKIRIKSLSLGIVIPDITFELAKRGEPMYVFSPYDLQKEYGKEMSWLNISDIYYEAVDNPRIRKNKLDARWFLNTIAELQVESGYPYIMFEDSVNRQNQLDGKIVMSNLCSEIFQPQTPSLINEDQTYDEIGKDISCNLASFNVRKVLESPDMGKSVEVAVRMLTQVSDLSDIRSVPTVANGNSKAHAIGLGAMNLHGAFAYHHMYYGDKESLDLTNMYFYTVTYHAISASNKIARERKQSFDGFEKSKYASGEFFERFINPADPKMFAPRTKKVSKIFENVDVPTREDWVELAARVAKHGMYNQNLQAVPPTGSISYLNNSTSSVHPVTFNYVETRKEGKLGTVYVPTPEAEGNEKYFGEGQSMYTIDPKKVLDVYSVAQFYVDQGMSLTLGYPSSTTTKEIVKNIMYAQRKGKAITRELNDRDKILQLFPAGEIKSLYYVRILNEQLDEIDNSNECVACAL